MNYLAIDYWTSKIWLATNVWGIALPYKIIPNKWCIEELVKIIADKKIEWVVVGIPAHVDGRIWKQAFIVREFVENLKNNVSKEIIFLWQDERFTTYEAEASLEYVWYNKKNMWQVDDLAASIILQSFLDNWEQKHYL